MNMLGAAMLDVTVSNTKACLSQALLQHYDEFAAFDEECAFLCDAFSCLAGHCEDIDSRTLSGLERHADNLKQKSYELRMQLKEIRALESEHSVCVQKSSTK